MRGGSLLAQRLDLGALALAGEPRVLAEQVITDFSNHHHDFTVSAGGRLVYRSASPDTQLVWVDRSGQAQQTLLGPRRFGVFHLSPSARTVVFEQYDADGRGDDVWLLDVARGVTTRFTNDPASDVAPVWSPDGASIAFMSMRTGLGDLYVADAGGANARLLTKDVAPWSWSPDGAWILLGQDTATDSDLLLYSTRTGEKGIRDEAISRDGRFLYAIDADAQQLFGWMIGEAGALAPIGAFDGIPATVAGLAAG